MARKQLGSIPANPTDDVTKSYADAVNTTGSAAKLTTARTIRTDLTSTSTASFDGSANITPGVNGNLPITNGGTGVATLPTGILKGAGTGAITAATVGTDYAPATAGTSALKGSGSGGFLAATLNDVATATADYSVGGFKLTSVGTPTTASDAATKSYVDAAAIGIDWKPSVRAATTTAGTLASSFANASVIDGVTLATNDRILIKNQATGSENGIYVVAASGAPTRGTDANSSAQVTPSMAVFVEEGTANADSGWVLTNNGAITLGTTSLNFTQFTGLGQITANNGLSQSGNTVSIENSGVLTVSHGGTGAGTLTGIVKGNGTSAMTTITAPTGAIVGDTDSQILTSKTLTNPTVNNYIEGVVAIGTISTGPTAISLTSGTIQTATLTASTACGIQLPAAAAGKSFTLIVTQAATTGNGTITWTTASGTLKWNVAGTPTMTATINKIDIYSFFSEGTNWYGSYTQGY